MIKSYKELIVWQKSMDLVHEVYSITDKLPAKERFILISQMLRAAISIPSNIAEGWSRNHKLEFVRFLFIAYASAAELETQILILKKQYPKINCSRSEEVLAEIQRMLLGLAKKARPSFASN
jgi:four helix bundle protein